MVELDRGGVSFQSEGRCSEVADATSAPTFAHTSPYQGSWLSHVYGTHFRHLYGEKLIREADLREKILMIAERPSLMFMGNFIVDRAGIVSLCRELGINVIHCEDGFFPHYNNAHGDPLGFSWESSLTQLSFRRCVDEQRQRARSCRELWLEFAPEPLPDVIREPFVLWPLQLIGDKVNQWDLNEKSWGGLIRHFRESLPSDFQLVIKHHPRAKANDNTGLAALASEIPNTVILPGRTHLKSLLLKSSAVAGANSTVLLEARLMFQKPTYVYARGWFTNHFELFTPIHARHAPRELNRFEFVENPALMRNERLDEYADWFLVQLLARQVDLKRGRTDPVWLKERVDHLSYNSWVKYGEEIFQRFD
jgi:hypothetical protein